MGVLLFFVFAVAVALGVRLFGHGLSLLRADLEPQVPDVPDEVPKKDDQEAKTAVQA